MAAIKIDKKITKYRVQKPADPAAEKTGEGRAAVTDLDIRAKARRWRSDRCLRRGRGRSPGAMCR